MYPPYDCYGGYSNYQCDCYDVPQKKTEDCEKTDIIVIGAGTAGCVIAGRRAMDGKTVRVLEQGPDTSFTSKDPDVQFDKPLIKLPIAVFQLYESYTSTGSSTFHPSSTLLDYVTKAPGRTADERQYFRYPRCHGAGGCTSHHAMQDGVGSLKLYDEMSKDIKDSYFNGENANKLFKRMEDASTIPNSSSYSGQDGWLKIRYGTPHDIQKAILEEVKDNEKYGKTPEVTLRRDPEGIGLAAMQANVNEDGKPFRSYAYQDLIATPWKNAPNKDYVKNITVNFNTHVSRLLFKGNKCVGVEVDVQKANNVSAPLRTEVEELNDGTFKSKFRNKEDFQNPSNDPWIKESTDTVKRYYADTIVLCAGAIQSPQILMLSGIGPKEHLKEMGIDVLVDSPGVGSNMTDHTELGCIFELDARKTIHPWQSNFIFKGLSAEEFPADYKDAFDNAVANSKESFGENAGVITWDWYSDNNDIGKTWADIHAAQWDAAFWNFDYDYSHSIDQSATLSPEHHNHNFRHFVPSATNALVADPDVKKEDIVLSQFNNEKPRVFITWLIELLKPTRGKTNGTIRLKSKDPRDEPIIDQKLYEDREGLLRMAKFLKRRVRPVMDALREKWGVPEGQRYEWQPGPGAETEEQIADYIAYQSSYGHHMSGTCQMGPKSAADGDVVDSHFRVNGTKNLYLADTSVYRAPFLHTYNTSRAGYFMGEACADRLKNPNAKAPQ